MKVIKLHGNYDGLQHVKKFGIDFYYSDEMAKSDSTNPLRVNNNTGAIEVNRVVFDKFSEPFQYFLLKWAMYIIQFKDNFKADCTALYDMLNQFQLPAQQRVSFLQEFIKLFNNGSKMNEDRIKSMGIELIQIK